MSWLLYTVLQWTLGCTCLFQIWFPQCVCPEVGLLGQSFKSQYLLCCCSVAQSCLTLCDPMDCSTTGFLSFAISQNLLKLMSIESVMPSNQFHPLSSSSLPAFSLSQHQGLFKWVGPWHQVAKVLVLQLQHVLPMNTQDWFLLGLTDLISLQSEGLSRVFSNNHSFCC